MSDIDDRLIIAIDTPSITRAHIIIAATRKLCHNYKFGLTFFANNSMADIDELDRKFGIKAMIDKKYHDIPSQVADAVTELAHYHFVRYATLHISGGRKMLEAAVAAADIKIVGRDEQLKLLGITVLTSLADDDIVDIIPEAGGIGLFNVATWVAHLDKLATEVKLPGRVCSVHEVHEMRRRQFRNASEKILVVPGISMGDANPGQSRVGTPSGALNNGATHIVVGRHIINQPSPEAMESATQEIIDDMG